MGIFGLMDTAYLTGLLLTNGNADFRVEYANNERYDAWYDASTLNRGVNMGHFMGNFADDLFFEMAVRHNPWTLSVSYDRTRHDSSKLISYRQETRDQYGLKPSYRFEKFVLFADLFYNHHENVNFSNDPLTVDIHPDTRLDEVISGAGVEINF